MLERGGRPHEDSGMYESRGRAEAEFLSHRWGV